VPTPAFPAEFKADIMQYFRERKEDDWRIYNFA
jgi:hypothetical protein